MAKRKKENYRVILTPEEIDALLSASDEPKKEQTAADLALEEEIKKAMVEEEKARKNGK